MRLHAKKEKKRKNKSWKRYWKLTRLHVLSDKAQITCVFCSASSQQLSVGLRLYFFQITNLPHPKHKHIHTHIRPQCQVIFLFFYFKCVWDNNRRTYGKPVSDSCADQYFSCHIYFYQIGKLVCLLNYGELCQLNPVVKILEHYMGQ